MIGRAAERDALDQVVASARRGFSATLVLRGEAGIGKTALLDYAAGSASDFRVLRVTGIESEMELGFAGLHQLVLPLLSGMGSLPEPQRRALTSAVGLIEGAAPDLFLVGLATLTLLSEAANDRAVLCVVDDAQWLDRTSADVLAFIARRMNADRVAFLFAVREPSRERPDLEGLRSLRVFGLDPEDARRLVQELVTGPLEQSVGDRITTHAAGNPLALTEMTRELTPAQLAGTEWLPDPLPLSADVQARYWRKVARLSAAQRHLLLLAAAEPSGDAELFERAARHLGLDSDIARTAEIGDLLALEDHVTFRHPLIRSAVYRGSGYESRRRVHQAIAAVSDRERDADRIAWHLAAAARGADEEIADLLERSADRAKSRGGPFSAASILRRAADLTPDQSRRGRRLLAAAQAEFAGGRAVIALALLDQATLALRASADATGETIRDQAAGLRLRGTIQFALGEGHQASSTLLQAARTLAPLDAAAARDTLLEGMIAAFYSGAADRHAALVAAQSFNLTAGTVADADIASLIVAGYVTLLTDGVAAAAPLLRRAVSALVDEGLPADQGLRWYGFGMWCATELFDFDAWHLMAIRWVALCREIGALSALPLALDYLGTWQVLTGGLGAAEASNAEGRDILSATGTPDRLGTRAVEILAPTWRGQVDRVRDDAAAMIRYSAERGQEGGVFYCHLALTVLEISVRNYQTALEHACVLLNDNGPYFGAVILPDAVEAAVRCGDRVTADLALERLAARADASGTELAAGLLARCRALVGLLDNDGNGDDSERHFAAAIRHLEKCRAAAQLARTHLLFGEWLRLRQHPKRAEVHLRAAAMSFEAIGAEKFAERARIELAATGAHVGKADGHLGTRAGAQLTQRETQVAELVVSGATNAEVAAKLFISANTVDYHLRHIYQKLGVTSRTKLAAALR